MRQLDLNTPHISKDVASGLPRMLGMLECTHVAKSWLECVYCHSLSGYRPESLPQGIDAGFISDTLDACLLTDEEIEAGEEEWVRWEEAAPAAGFWAAIVDA